MATASLTSAVDRFKPPLTANSNLAVCADTLFLTAMSNKKQMKKVLPAFPVSFNKGRFK
jgi:hypothetical protein